MLDPSDFSHVGTKLGIHGFESWAAFARATLSLGLSLGTVLYAGLLFGLDQRYAHKTTEAVTERLVAEVRATREKILAGQIFDMRMRECISGAPEVRQAYASRLAELETEYQTVTGRSYRIQDCETFR